MDDYDPTTESTLLLHSRLTQHVLMKGWQAGGLIGMLAVVPIQSVWSRSFSLPRAARSCAISSFVGIGLAGVALAAKSTQITREGLEDRVYRLHYNQGQKRTDAMSTWGAVLGLVAAAAAGRYGVMTMSTHQLIGGAAAGSAAGVLLHLATSSEFKETPKRAMQTMKEEVKSS